MSFCRMIKNELGALKTPECCRLPLTYGFLLFSRAFGSEKISMQTENKTAAELYARLLRENYGATVEIKTGGKAVNTFRACVPDVADRLKILASVDFGIAEGRINRETFERPCCPASFIRGAFLACGQIADPDKEYRVDFPVREKSLADEFAALLEEHNIKANISKRANGYLVYIKQREMIIDLLTLTGASARSLELIEKTIIKDVKNNTNRARNCVGANIRRAANASVRQRRAIEFLKKKGIFENLPQELVNAGQLRLDYPIETLSELTKLSNEPISVSGLNHRLQRIERIYAEKKDGK